MSEDIRSCCQAFYQVLSDYFDGELSDEDTAHVRGHVALCPPCGVYLEQFRVIYEATGQVGAEDLPADFCQVMERVLGKWKRGG